MISAFNERDMRDSAVIYKSTFEQIKKLYSRDKEMAGELAISAIELVLTGEISSDNYMIEVILEDLKVINEKNKVKYERAVENKKEYEIQNQKLKEIAEMSKQGMTQQEIATAIGTTQQNISKRLKKIRVDYPELLESNTLQQIQQIQLHDNDNVNDNVNENVCNVIRANAQIPDTVANAPVSRGFKF